MSEGRLRENGILAVEDVASATPSAVWSEVVVLAVERDFGFVTIRRMTVRPPLVVSAGGTNSCVR